MNAPRFIAVGNIVFNLDHVSSVRFHEGVEGEPVTATLFMAQSYNHVFLDEDAIALKRFFAPQPAPELQKEPL
jgi:hypothetical protein